MSSTGRDGRGVRVPGPVADASGFVRTVDFSAARAMPGVLAVLSCTDPPELGSAEDPELALFATREISYRGQLVAAVVADTLENARAAAAAVLLSMRPGTSMTWGCGRIIPASTRRRRSTRACPR